MLCGFRKNKTKTKVYSEEEVNELLKVEKDIVYGYAVGNTDNTFKIICRKQGKVVTINFDFTDFTGGMINLSNIPDKYLPVENTTAYNTDDAKIQINAIGGSKLGGTYTTSAPTFIHTTYIID